MKISNYWLALGVTALSLSGLFTILLIIGRTTNSLPPQFFSPALIVHVNLDVLVWLLAITISHFNTQKKTHKPISFFAAAIGTAMITISPFIGTGEAYQNNYIPIFDNTMFKAGIALFLGAIAYESATTLFSKAKYKTKTVAVLIVFSFSAFVASYIGILDKTSSHAFFETLFWGGGHILQFAYVQIMLIAWLILASQGNVKVLVNQKIRYFIFTLPIIFTGFALLFIYSASNVESVEHFQMFTQVMIYGTSIAAIPLGLLLLLGIIVSPKWNLYSVTLALSMLLFAIGGALGQTAAQAVANGEITTIIPAHYHFSSVAVTIALMGYIFFRLNIEKSALAFWQIMLYTIGQICYFTGMAIFGGHGAARKTPGVDMIMMDESTKKMVQGIMHGGGSLSLIGGILFVVIVIKHFSKANNLANNNQTR